MTGWGETWSERLEFICRTATTTSIPDELEVCRLALKLLGVVHLYRHFDAAGNLLYVGISLSTVDRLGQHACNAHWFQRISRIDVEKFGTRQEAEAAEREAIRKERPLYNKAGSPSWAPGARLLLPPPPPKADGSPRFDKRAYQRDLMRKRRAEKKGRV